jgi:hypothetical protein
MHIFAAANEVTVTALKHGYNIPANFALINFAFFAIGHLPHI